MCMEQVWGHLSWDRALRPRRVLASLFSVCWRPFGTCAGPLNLTILPLFQYVTQLCCSLQYLAFALELCLSICYLSFWWCVLPIPICSSQLSQQFELLKCCGTSQLYLGPGGRLYRMTEGAKNGLDQCCFFFRNSQTLLLPVVIPISWFHWFKECVVQGAFFCFGFCFAPSIFLDVSKQCEIMKRR